MSCLVRDSGRIPFPLQPSLMISDKGTRFVGVSISLMTENSEALLPVISASIGGRDGLYKHGNVFLDSGAQISLIRLETATSLGLEGKSVSITITKVGGEDEEIITGVLTGQQENISRKGYRYSLYQRRYSRHQYKGYHRRFGSKERKYLLW